MKMEPAFAAEHISQSYGHRQILTDISFLASSGECIGIAGRNGCGKSTLLSILAGVRKPQEGTISCCGYQLMPKKDAAARRNHMTFGSLIGYVPQTNPLLPDLSARDNLKLWTGGAIPKDSAAIRALELTDFLDRKTEKLSGGMKRRLAIACALINRPPVLILDEPASALDLYHRDAIFGYLRDYLSEGNIIIIATHDPEEMRFCSRLFRLQNSSVIPCTAEEAAEAIRKTGDGHLPVTDII